MAAATRALGGIPMPPPPNETEGYRIFFLLTVNGGILIVSLTLIGTVAASVFPAASAARKNVARGLAGALLLALPMTGASWSSPALAKATPSAQAILQAIDARRDTPQSGFVTEVRFTSFVSGRLDAEMLFKVAGLEGTTLAFNVSSPAGKRMAILSEGKGMWMQKEGMRKSFRVSPAQRLMGGASNADVITVHFATDYVPSEMKVSGTKYMLVLAPKPGSESAAYGKIRVIATADGQVTAGEFYAVSGKLLKTSRFAYSKDATKSLKSALITDALRPNETTRVDYGAIVPLKLAESFFNIQNMLQSAQKLVP
jgi:outer membrane lipoprotein-sorting protein